MKRKLLVIAAVAMVVSVLSVSGCSMMGGSSGSSSSESGTLGGSSGGSADDGSAGDGSAGGGFSDGGAVEGDAGGDAADGTASSPEVAQDGRDAAVDPGAQIVTSGLVSLLSSDPIGVADKAVALTESVGGHVDNRTESAGNRTGGVLSDQPGGGSAESVAPLSRSGNARADLILRIPSDKVTQTIDSLKQLATVDSVAISATDITTQVSDVDARITALQTSVTRLLDLMSKATTTTDLIALESTLSERQSDLDGLTAQRNSYTDQVEYSSITVTIEDLSSAPASTPGDFWSGLATGWNSLVAAFTGGLVGFGIALPWLAVLAVMAAIAVAVVRVVLRGSRRRAGAGSSAGGES